MECTVSCGDQSALTMVFRIAPSTIPYDEISLRPWRMALLSLQCNAQNDAQPCEIYSASARSENRRLPRWGSWSAFATLSTNVGARDTN